VHVSPERRVPFCVLCGALLYSSLVLFTRVEGLCSCGVSVPGVRFVDAANGVLGIEWVNGKSVRCLLGSRDEEEDESEDGDENEARADEDPLREYAISKGTISHCYLFRTSFFFSLDGTRCIDGDGGYRDSKDAPGGYHTWRPDNVEHDAAPSVFYH
jgi:hypothetical protein